jgi:hypothetical protein
MRPNLNARCRHLRTVVIERMTARPHFGRSLFGLTGGFVIGNLFGTLLNFFRSVLVWDGFIIVTMLLAIEGLNFANFRGAYAHGRRSRTIVTFKMGLLLGFFTDAFKVGS